MSEKSSSLTIVGIDPGLRATGWGVIKKLRDGKLCFVDAGTVKPYTEGDLAYRLEDLHEKLQEKLLRFDIDHAAVEESFTTKNHNATLKLGHARGVALLSARLCGVSVAEYSARRVKQAITGSGRADKNQMMAMIKILLPQAQFDSDHAADALAIAICHAHEMNPLLANQIGRDGQIGRKTIDLSAGTTRIGRKVAS